MKGIHPPTVVVVGDRSSGKTSVLESLAGIRFSTGRGISTRVPLIIRLQNHPIPEPVLFLGFNGKIVSTDQEHTVEAISAATEEIAGKGKEISNNPITLLVKKNGIPNLTMVDLPGITYFPIQGEPKDIRKQISRIIKEFITPQENIILHVLSAGDPFFSCEDINKFDKSWQRTLAVVTHVDESPEGLIEKIATHACYMGPLGYVCVRNRIGDESFEEARAEEANLFKAHPVLSKINKPTAGIPVLAERLVKIQSTIILECLPDIVRKTNHKLSTNVEKLNRSPKNFTSIAKLMHILGSVKESLRKIVLLGEFDECPSAADMHCTARLSEMLNKYSSKLQSQKMDEKDDFLMDEIKVLEETKSIVLPNFFPRAAFLMLLERRVKAISEIPLDFVQEIWDYMEGVVNRILFYEDCGNYPQLLSGKAVESLIAKKKQQSIDWMNGMLEMEKFTNYTCSPEYTTSWNRLMGFQSYFIEQLNSDGSFANIDGFGDICIDHLRDFKGIVQEAYNLKMMMTAYWDIVLRRIEDNMALHARFSIRQLVNEEMERDIISEVMGCPCQGNGLEMMLGESPSIFEKQKSLNKSIKLLKDVASIMDKVVIDFD